MENENKDVKQEPVVATPVQEEQQQATEVSEDVKTPDVVDKSVYESVRKAMKREREEKKAKEQTISELETRLSELETRERNAVINEDYDPYKAKTDIMFLMNKDPFVKDNLDLIEQKMTDTNLDVTSAVREVKADFFDRIQRETISVENNKPPKQEKTTATQEEIPAKLSGDLLKDAMSGKLENVSNEQMAAIKRVLGR